MPRIVRRRCLKCNKPIKPPSWLCPDCRRENQDIAPEAVGVADLYYEGDK